MNSERLKILFLSAWYPNRYDAMSGLFVRKHAESVARFSDVCVLYPVADELVSDFDIVEQTTNSVSEIYVYFPYLKIPFIRKISKVLNYWHACIIGYNLYRKKYGKQDITHVNILTRSAVLAYWLKLTEHIPYVITEHWTRYLPQNFSYKNILRRWCTKFFVKRASCVMPVSAILEKAMKECRLQNHNYVRIDNVVDDFFFYKQEKTKREKKRILHVSCFLERAKNIVGILRVIQQLSLQRNDFELVIVGKGVDFDFVQKKAISIGLSKDMVKFVGEQTPSEVCKWMYNSDFFLLFSNYETSGVVVLENLVCGRPVVSSAVGVVPEIINTTNGRIVNVGDESALLQEINWMLDNFQNFNEDEIRVNGEKYSYNIVGNQLQKIYRQILYNS